MPPNVENALYGSGKVAWHEMGNVIPGRASPAEIRAIVPELAAHVERRTLTDSAGVPATGWYSNTRTARTVDGDALPLAEKVVGVVKGRYEVYPAWAMVELLQEVVGTGELEYESAISLKGGSVVCLLAHMPEKLVIVGDAVDPYVLLVNSFDYSYALTYATTGVRVECQNMMNMALAGTARIIRIRHTQSARENVEAIRQALGLSRVYFDRVTEEAERLAAIKMSQSAGAKFIERLVPLPPPKPDPKDSTAMLPNRARDNAVDLRDMIRRIHDEAPDLANHRDNAWGWYQATVDYWDHARGSKTAEARFERLTLSTSASLPARAHKLLVA